MTVYSLLFFFFFFFCRGGGTGGPAGPAGVEAGGKFGASGVAGFDGGVTAGPNAMTGPDAEGTGCCATTNAGVGVGKGVWNAATDGCVDTALVRFGSEYASV